MIDEETEQGFEQSSNKDQDSFFLQEDQDEAIDKSEKYEEWIDFIKRCTEEA